MSVPTSFVTTSDGVRIAWSEMGAGRPLVLVRGWITHLELTWAEPAFRDFVTRLSTNQRVARFDTRGSGLSDRDIPKPGLDELVRDVEAVVDALDAGGGTPVALWGSTFGGPVAIAYAAAHPERVERLVLDGTYANGRDAWPPERTRSIASLLSTVRQDPEAAYAALSYMTSPEPSTRHEQRVDRVMQSIAPELLLHYYGLAAEFDVREAAAALRCPTLVLHRRASRVVPFDTGRALAASIPGARFVGLEGSGHNLWEQPSEPALRAVAEFTGSPVPAGEPLTAAAAAAPPDSPLVTIMFTDIYASTALTGQLGDAAAQELVRFHDAVVDEALGHHGGRVVKHTGDGVLARFPSASGALACAAEIQDRFDDRNDAEPDSPLLLRIGLNAGEPVAERGDVFGTVVQLASRLCTAARPGEIVVANVVRELAAGKGFRFVDLGEADLHGFPEPVRCYALRRGHERES